MAEPDFKLGEGNVWIAVTAEITRAPTDADQDKKAMDLPLQIGANLESPQSVPSTEPSVEFAPGESATVTFDYQVPPDEVSFGALMVCTEDLSASYDAIRQCSLLG